jgi:hypothetical protein
MKRIHLLKFFLLYCLLGCKSPATSDKDSGAESDKLTSNQVQQLVQEAYFHCFPIVENYKAIYAYSVDTSSPKYLPMNTPYHAAVLFSPADRFVVSPNNDTYYTTATLDLRAEPFVIQVPKITDRYYSFQFNSMVTDNFAYIGTNSTGTGSGVYAITSPSFSGQLPEGVTQIKAPCEIVGMIGRTAVNAQDPNDVKKAKAVESSYKLGVMHTFYPDYQPKKVAPIVFPPYSEASKSDFRFFSLLNFLLQFTNLSTDEQPIVDKYVNIGIKAGQPYTFYDEHPEFQSAIDNGIKLAIAQIDSSSRHLGKVENGWSMFPLGDYFGANYRDRTNIAKMGIYANSPREAYYPLAFVDAKGEMLDGRNNYSITFEANQLPPVKYFWSLTMYDNANQLLVENAINRYSIGDRTAGMKYNSDGSLTIYIGNAKPPQGSSNWLPAPAAGFNVMMRLYGPRDNVLNGSWAPPPIVKLEGRTAQQVSK